MQKLKEHLATNYYELYKEWHYRDIEARVFGEELLGANLENQTQDSGQNQSIENDGFQALTKQNYTSPQDYRFFTFDKNNMFVQFDYGKYWYFYDLYWNFQYFSYRIPILKDEIKKPQNLKLMRIIATNLACSFTRVDLYEVDSRVYVGELTFTPNGGTIKWNPNEWDKKLGEMWG